MQALSPCRLLAAGWDVEDSLPLLARDEQLQGNRQAAAPPDFHHSCVGEEPRGQTVFLGSVVEPGDKNGKITERLFLKIKLQ